MIKIQNDALVTANDFFIWITFHFELISMCSVIRTISEDLRKIRGE